jgi:RNase P protein component
MYVFVARPSIAERPFDDVQKQVQTLLRKLDTQPKKRSK